MTTQLEPPVAKTTEGASDQSAIGQRLRIVAAQRAEETLAEVPRIARRLGTLLLVLAVSVPILVVAIVALVWHFVA